MGYRIRRVDKNQPAIVAKFRAMGASVAILSSVGNGLPDLLIALDGGWSCLVEIKDGSQPASKRKLTSDERKFFDGWLGNIAIIASEAEAEKLVEAGKNGCSIRID